MTRPRLLDLFCCQGGAGHGHVVGSSAAELLAHRARVLCTIAELRAVIHKEGTPTP